jgi:hypothetical protein
MRNFLDTINGANVVKGINGWGEASVETEDLVVDESGEREVVEEVCKVLPNVGVAVLAQALVVEAVDLCDLAGLVIASEDGDAPGVSDFEGNEQSYGLDRVVSSINVVTC